uniref:Uncharacterized protein n=1 Tax=Anguilla anguilla TaxID=7936 RepID=A0A0E9W2L2_ANGAN
MNAFIRHFSRCSKCFAEIGGNSPQPPPMCSTHLGDAWLPFGARTLTTHQLMWSGRGHFFTN